MADAVGMQIVKGIEGLAHNKSCLFFSQLLSFRNKVEKFASIAQSIKTQEKYEISKSGKNIIDH